MGVGGGGWKEGGGGLYGVCSKRVCHFVSSHGC